MVASEFKLGQYQSRAGWKVSKKNCTGLVKQTRKTWFNTINNRGERLNSTSLKQKTGEFLKCWNELGKMCWEMWRGLLIGIHLSLSSVRPQRPGNRSTIFIDDCISRGWLPGPGERLSLVVKLSGDLEKIYISEGHRKNLKWQITNFK